MPSKWLNWRPGDEIVRNSLDLRPAKTAESLFAVFAGSIRHPFSIIHEQEQPIATGIETNESTRGSEKTEESCPPELARTAKIYEDFYVWSMDRTIEFMNASNYPEGMIPWLETAAPYLYDHLTRSLPDRISRAWDAKIPFDDFDSLCLEFGETHKRAVECYRQYLRCKLPNESNREDSLGR